jgi:1,4-dihydroxy-2-naphthoyl-CoA hydrolase
VFVEVGSVVSIKPPSKLYAHGSQTEDIRMSAFEYERTIHFADTDAAGVVFFARYLAIAHEAYEEALGSHGLPLATFFKDTGLVVPIAKSEASYLRPLHTGERILVSLQSTRESENAFTIDYTLWKTKPTKKRAAVITTKHVCINSTTRQQAVLPDELAAWVDG